MAKDIIGFLMSVLRIQVILLASVLKSGRVTGQYNCLFITWLFDSCAVFSRKSRLSIRECATV